MQVMPALWCHLDRLWFGHPGVLPGTKTDQPFLCPLDHVFEVSLSSPCGVALPYISFVILGRLFVVLKRYMKGVTVEY